MAQKRKPRKKPSLAKVLEDTHSLPWRRAERKAYIERAYDTKEWEEEGRYPEERLDLPAWSEKMRRMHAESILEDYRQHTFHRWTKKGADVQKLESEINRFVRTFSPVPKWIHDEIRPAIAKHLESVGELKGLARKDFLPHDLVRAAEDAATNLSDGISIGLGTPTGGRPGAPPKDALYEFASKAAEILRPLGKPWPKTTDLISNVIPGGYEGSPDSLRRKVREWKASQRRLSDPEQE